VTDSPMNSMEALGILEKAALMHQHEKVAKEEK
jgi:hypothetical protein